MLWLCVVVVDVVVWLVGALVDCVDVVVDDVGDDC